MKITTFIFGSLHFNLWITYYIKTYQKIRVTNIQTIELLYTIEPGESALSDKEIMVKQRYLYIIWPVSNVIIEVPLYCGIDHRNYYLHLHIIINLGATLMTWTVWRCVKWVPSANEKDWNIRVYGLLQEWDLKE